jgi:cytoskeleton protein RodZ
MSAFGDTLRQARAQKGLTLREAEHELRINRHYLAALEEESFEHLPALAYQRGIVRSYAAYLGLDPARLVIMFEEARGIRTEEGTLGPATPPLDMPNHWAPNFAIIAFTLIAGAVLLTWVYSAFLNPPPEEAVTASLQPTVTPVDADLIFVPSPTPLVPTATPTPLPSPTPTITPIPEPSTTPAIQESASNLTQQQAESAITDSTSSSLPAALPDGQASIRVTALADLWLEIAVDGDLVFQGSLAQGESTGWATGSTFSVYTSGGRFTQFTNHIGQDFFMGEEAGEAVYYLQG